MSQNTVASVQAGCVKPKMNDSIYVDAGNIHDGKMLLTNILEGASNAADAASEQDKPFLNMKLHEKDDMPGFKGRAGPQRFTKQMLVRVMNSNTSMDATVQMHNLGHEANKMSTGGSIYGMGVKQETGSRGLNSVTTSFAVILDKDNKNSSAHFSMFGKFRNSEKGVKEFTTLFHGAVVNADGNVTVPMCDENLNLLREMMSKCPFPNLTEYNMGDFAACIETVFMHEVVPVAKSDAVPGNAAMVEMVTDMDSKVWNYTHMIPPARAVNGFKTYDGRTVSTLTDVCAQKCLKDRNGVATDLDPESSEESAATIACQYFPQMKNVPSFTACGKPIVWQCGIHINDVHYLQFMPHIATPEETPVIQVINDTFATRAKLESAHKKRCDVAREKGDPNPTRSSTEYSYASHISVKTAAGPFRLAILVCELQPNLKGNNAVGAVAFWRNRHMRQLKNNKNSFFGAVTEATLKLFNPDTMDAAIGSCHDQGMQGVLIPLWVLLDMPSEADMRSQYGASFWEILCAVNHSTMTTKSKKCLHMIACLCSTMYVQLGDVPVNKTKNKVDSSVSGLDARVLSAVVGFNLKHVIQSERGLKESLEFIRKNPDHDNSKPRAGQKTNGSQPYFEKADIESTLASIRTDARKKYRFSAMYCVGWKDAADMFSRSHKDVVAQKREEAKAAEQKKQEAEAKKKAEEERERLKQQAAKQIAEAKEEAERAKKQAAAEAKKEAEKQVREQQKKAEEERKRLEQQAAKEIAEAKEEAERVKKEAEQVKNETQNDRASRAKTKAMRDGNKQKNKADANFQIGLHTLGWLTSMGTLNANHPAHEVATSWVEHFRETKNPFVACQRPADTAIVNPTRWFAIGQLEALCLILGAIRKAKESGTYTQPENWSSPAPGQWFSNVYESEEVVISLIQSLRNCVLCDKSKPLCFTSDYEFINQYVFFNMSGTDVTMNPQIPQAMVDHGLSDSVTSAQEQVRGYKPPKPEPKSKSKKRKLSAENASVVPPPFGDNFFAVAPSSRARFNHEAGPSGTSTMSSESGGDDEDVGIHNLE